jgi:general secretion pathway protein A
MYEFYYGLTTRPFQLNPDPAFYFASKQHQKAKAYLEYGLSLGEGFVVITGEVGAGKTTVLRGVLESLDSAKVNLGHLVTTQLDAQDTLRMVAAAFGVDATASTKAQLLMSIEAYLTQEAMQGKRCLLVVDEAQNLAPAAVEELRMLSNYQLGTKALLQTFLVGQPQLRTMIQRPEMEQLRQRVVATCHLGPMDMSDSLRYVGHRLHCAGAVDVPSFEADALAAIHRAGGGIPRRINSICDRLLLWGYLNDRKTFVVGDVEEVSQEMLIDLRSGSSADDVPVGMSMAAAAENDPGLRDELRQIERSVMRIERTVLDTLAIVNKLAERLEKQPEMREP